jgi:hypothetical protein
VVFTGRRKRGLGPIHNMQNARIYALNRCIYMSYVKSKAYSNAQIFCHKSC